MPKTRKFSELSDAVLADSARAERVNEMRAAVEDALALAEIRELRELTQEDIAKALQVSQANVSRVERQGDLYLSTLQRYVAALGGRLEVTAIFEDERVPIAV
jgi:hypothetical protein